MPGRSTPDPDMFQQLPISENRQQQSYALINQNRTLDSEYMLQESVQTTWAFQVHYEIYAILKK